MTNTHVMTLDLSAQLIAGVPNLTVIALGVFGFSWWLSRGRRDGDGK